MGSFCDLLSVFINCCYCFNLVKINWKLELLPYYWILKQILLTLFYSTSFSQIYSLSFDCGKKKQSKTQSHFHVLHIKNWFYTGIHISLWYSSGYERKTVHWSLFPLKYWLYSKCWEGFLKKALWLKYFQIFMFLVYF